MSPRNSWGDKLLGGRQRSYEEDKGGVLREVVAPDAVWYAIESKENTLDDGGGNDPCVYGSKQRMALDGESS